MVENLTNRSKVLKKHFSLKLHGNIVRFMDSKLKNKKGKNISPVSDIQLRDLAGKLGKEWEKLAINLKFRLDEIERLKSDHQWEEDRIFQLLIDWRQRQPMCAKDATSNLRKALKKSGRNDLASDLGNPEFDVEACRKELFTYYQTNMGLIQLVPWDDETEAMDTMFVNLELTHETTRRTNNQSGRTLCRNDELFTLENWEGKRVNRVLISGGPGSGKSTLLAKLAYDWAQQKPETPISHFALVFHIEFREISKGSNHTLSGAIFDQLLPTHSKIDRNDLEQYIRKNQPSCLILADGFDERSSGIIDKNTPNEIDSILAYRDFRDCFLVVSTRPHKIYNLGSASKMYTQVALSGFPTENVSAYIHKYFSGNEESAEALISEISKSKNLQKLSKIPYMLILLCLIWSEDRNLPETQTKLYQQAMFYMWKRYCFKKTVQADDDELQEQLDKLLVDLGKTVCKTALAKKEEQISFSQSSFHGNTYEKACAVGIVTKEKARSKLQGSSNITFVHKSFQEFCAACYLVNMALTNHVEFLEFIATVRNRDEVSKLFEILGFSCGLNATVADTILKHLAGVFHGLSPEVSYITHGKYGIWPLFVFARESEIPYSSLHEMFKPLFTSSILFSPESLTDQEWIAFEIFLQTASKSDQQSILHNISALDCGDFLSSNCIRLLSMVLEKMVPKLQTLALRNASENTSEGWDREHLTEAITKLPMLSDLSVDFSDDVSGRLRYFDLADFLSKISSKKLSSLDIRDSKNHKMSFDVTKLVSYLSDQALISSFSLANLKVNPESARFLVQALQSKRNLTKLHFSGTNVQEAVADIGPLVGQLESLQMSNCEITDIHMKPFAQYAVNAERLKVLNLSQNVLRDCQSFGTELRHCRAIEELCMSYAGITDDGIKAISQSLPDMPYLKKLDVGHNKFGLKGLEALFMGLHSAGSLMRLYCGPCPVPIEERCSLKMSEFLAVAGVHLPVVRNFHKLILLVIDEQEIISKMLLDRSWECDEDNFENADEKADSANDGKEKDEQKGTLTSDQTDDGKIEDACVDDQTKQGHTTDMATFDVDDSCQDTGEASRKGSGCTCTLI